MVIIYGWGEGTQSKSACKTEPEADNNRPFIEMIFRQGGDNQTKSLLKTEPEVDMKTTRWGGDVLLYSNHVSRPCSLDIMMMRVMVVIRS